MGADGRRRHRVVYTHGFARWQPCDRRTGGVGVPSGSPWLMAGLPMAAYAVGSIPWGAWIARIWSGVDVRRSGSGNIGATNVARLAGAGPGALTLLADTAKGAVPTAIARALYPGEPAFVCLVALAAFLGHLYPIYSRFRGGGKGVATAAGGFFAITPGGAAAAFLVFLLVACWSDRVSAGSLCAAAALPVIVWNATHREVDCAAAAVVAVFVIWRHRKNIARLIDGSEPRMGGRPRPPAAGG